MPEPAPVVKRRRHSKACGRCRKRKIRCDFDYPICGACTAAGASCMGFDADEKADQPRSIVHHLEQQVAQLQVELAGIKNQPGRYMSQDRINDAIDGLSKHLAFAAADPLRHMIRTEQLLPLVDKFFLSNAPLPAFFIHEEAAQDHEQLSYNEPQSQSGHPINIVSLPRHVVNAMLQHYCKTYRPQYPSIDEADLYRARDRLYADRDIVGYDAFVVYITLAISSNTLAHSDEKRAAATTYGLWSTAIGHLGKIGHKGNGERLQALQLLTHYGFLNPQHVNVSHCAAAASRLAIQLGLHEELSLSGQVSVDVATLNTRRRMFWNAYGIDAAAHTTRCLPFRWRRPGFTAMLPDSESQATPTQSAHMWCLREIECAVINGLYYPQFETPTDGVAVDNESWRSQMQKRLDSWHQTVRESVSLSEKIEFHELLYQIQILRLNRPSPRCAKPSREMRRTALKASIRLVKEYSVLDRLGRMFMLWHATYCITEAGVYLLSSVVTGLSSTNQDRESIGGEDVGILAKYIKTFSGLLNKVSRRWSSISPYSSVLSADCTSVLDLLQQWSTGENVSSVELGALEDRFACMGTLSVTATVTEIMPLSIGSNTDFEPPPITTLPLSMAFPYPALESSGSHDPYIGAESITGSAWASGPSAIDSSLSIFPEVYPVGYNDPMLWDFSGVDSEEIFAAMLEGETFNIGSSTIGPA